MVPRQIRARSRNRLVSILMVLVMVASLGGMSAVSASAATAPVLTALSLGGAPVVAGQTFNFWYNGASFTFDLNSLTLAGADQNGNPFSISGLPASWSVLTGPAALGSDGHTLTITGSTDGSSTPQKNLNPIRITAGVNGVASNVLNLEVRLSDTTEDASCDSTDSLPVRVFYNGALDETVLVTSPMLEALNPNSTIYQYSYMDNAYRCKFYSGWGPKLTGIITNYTSLSSAQLSNMVTDTTGTSKILFTGVDNYQAWWPCGSTQSELSLQDLLSGPLYYYPDGTGTNIMNGGYKNFIDDANTQVAPATIAVLAMGDPLQHFYSVSDLDNQRTLRLYMGMKNTTDIEDNNSVKWVDEMDITMPLQDNPASGVTLGKSADDINTGGSDQLTATIAPANGVSRYITWNNVTWASSNPSVATVDQTGKVTAVAPGSANISVTASNLTATCAVTVQAATTTITGSATLGSFSGALTGQIQVYVDGTQQATTDAGGNYTISGVSPGSHTLVIESPGYLKAEGTITVAGSTSIPAVTLIAGDVNGDGVINIDDYTDLVQAYGATSGSSHWNAAADFNRDGVINIDDYTDLVVNYGKSAAQIP